MPMFFKILNNVYIVYLSCIWSLDLVFDFQTFYPVLFSMFLKIVTFYFELFLANLQPAFSRLVNN